MSSAPPPPYTEKGYSNYPGAPPVGMVPPMYVGAPVFVPSEYPMQCTCPNCRQTIVTRTVKENGLLTWLCIGGLVLIGCWFGCCLIPLCVDACKDTVHYCPSCSIPLGVKKVL